jgi:hypothetical protein
VEVVEVVEVEVGFVIVLNPKISTFDYKFVGICANFVYFYARSMCNYA